MPTAMENYLFDLRGYLVLKGAVAPEHVRRINQAIDQIPPLFAGADRPLDAGAREDPSAGQTPRAHRAVKGEVKPC